MTQTLSPDTGEIPRIDPGQTTTRLSEAKTEILSYASVASYRRPDATGEIPSLSGPLPPRPMPPIPPLPAPPKDMAAAQPIFPLERVAGADEAQVLELIGRRRPQWREAEPSLLRRLAHRPKHRRPSPLWGLAQLVGITVVGSALLLWVIS
jgi:hypothetical protein